MARSLHLPALPSPSPHPNFSFGGAIANAGQNPQPVVIEVVKRPELHTFKVLPKRWIVERTFGWFNWYRRLSKDYEHNPQTSEAMIHFTASTLMLKRLATL